MILPVFAQYRQPDNHAMSFSAKDGWFTETGVLNSDNVNVSIKMNDVLEKRKSQFQDILLFKK